MHQHKDRYPPAPPDRDADARRLFPYRTMSAEEYAARHGSSWVCFSFGDYVYEDEALNEWIHTVDDIFFIPGRMQEAERKYLSDADLHRRNASMRAFLDPDGA
jgi:hypothetical protein